MPAITKVIETSLYVDDVARATAFYESLFDFTKLVYDERMCALDVCGQQVLLLFLKGAILEAVSIGGGVIPPHHGEGHLHLAFAIPTAAMPEWEARLAEAGIAIESRVKWPRGGESIYFRDPDQHLIELITPGCWATY